ncbi:PKD domain-containing protein [Novipirellula artificiosorum]|uniref:Putative endoglucanase n=1 Tax=Novipirellula artificiosorum TaxID=2528016 RepID=A0A5C6E1C0_9BACT|nr:PKD domain-containing protein [Novipirellula artificiosorum]TWU42692.1 putative endoglucanase [Novipirellula artificiosorum]
MQCHSLPSFLIALAITCSSVQAVEQWGVFELDAVSNEAPHTIDSAFSATFSQGSQSISVPGFWYKDDVFKVRFSPPTFGSWSYKTHSKYVSLDGKSGSIQVGKPSGDNHGPVQTFDTFYLRYADGKTYHQFGTTCYAWVHQPESLQQQTLKTLAASPFNKIRFCVFPKNYTYNKNEPSFFAFPKKADGTFDFDRPDPAFWEHFEQCVLDLQKLGIEADLILWHPYDRWGFADMSDAQDDRYLRYCIARLSAYRNVWWSLANEFDFMTNQPAGHRGNKQLGDWDRFYEILEKEDPHHRLRGIHNGRLWYDHTKPWVTHASLQTSDMKGGVRYRQQYQKPVIYDECKYEGNVPQGWGNLSGREMTQRFWLGTMSGCYVGHGETYLHDDDILWWSKGGVLHGSSPQRIQWLKDFMARSPEFDSLKPLGNDQGDFLLANPGEYYLLYALAGTTPSVTLSGDRPYKVDAIGPWEMQEWPVGTADPGKYQVEPSGNDMVYRFVPYAAGEKLRPLAKPTADVSEGVPPLAVKFTSGIAAKVEWDFGDGSASHQKNPAHTFDQPGIYTVTLKVTDRDGGSARSQMRIVVDLDSKAPIVRAGFRGDEKPLLQFNGTAKRSADGALFLPDGEPWGWVKAGDRPVEDLAGLRSFTISGWLKPESLVAGQGGNRILFCLQHDHSGIDLVCHRDGRLRLAVNEWPDGVQNDSSPGKLVVGKWTYFRVTYDSTATKNNVAWSFSSPLDLPASVASVKLDRHTDYNAGPVGSNVGPLALGNFNITLQGAGLDRQFRGEMRELEIFGSRISGIGALPGIRKGDGRRK